MKSEAIAKIDKELAAYKGGPNAEVMKKDVADTLKRLCELNEEFAQAVVQGGSFADCMSSLEKMAKGKRGMSDFDAYRAAAEFYFPGCVVEFQMQIHMSKYEVEDDTADAAAPADGILLRLEDYL